MWVNGNQRYTYTGIYVNRVENGERLKKKKLEMEKSKNEKVDEKTAKKRRKNVHECCCEVSSTTVISRFTMELKARIK